MSKRKKLLIAAAGVVLFGVIAAFWVWYTQERRAAFHDDTTGLSLAYRAPLTEQKITDRDKKDRIVFRLTEAKNAESALLVNARYESGLRPIATLARQDLRNVLNESMDKNFPGRYPEYKRLERRDFELNGKKATESVFTYKGKNGDLVKQRFLLVVKNDDLAVYLSAQAKAADFDRLNGRDFDTIFLDQQRSNNAQTR